MPNREEFLKGKVKYAHTKRLSKYGKWSVVLYPDEPSLAIVKRLIEEGIKNELKKDDDGYYITFGRPPEKLDRQGRRYTLEPVVVIDNEGRVFDGYIGNNSDCGVKIETYGGTTPQGSKYKAARLAGIKVFNLVPYEPSNSDQEKEVKAVQGFENQIAPVQTW